ncbi:MAG: molybdopterin-synthase adenylyltransferase MoeB [Gammaproteobacteria bacterium]|nr:MAG: molybdopterin-synthase adenylyltransferase MoeB [Gammaproteobacteria bacterium]
MNGERLQRYTRQMVLPQLGADGQAALAEAGVLIVGMGGLGCAAAQYLAGAGVGRLVLCDPDRVEPSNLHRQPLYGEADLGRPKVEAAAARLATLNGALEIQPLRLRLDEAEAARLAAGVDVVLDCSDNFATRHAVNRASRASGKPLVSGAAIRLEGQLAVFNHHRRAPCYACLFPESGGGDGERCSELGVLGPVPGMIGCLQALETIKLIAGFGEVLDGLLCVDGETLQIRRIRLRRDPDCPVCADD